MDTQNANEKQVDGTHYRTRKGGVQHWDICIEENVPNLEYAASKYLTRWRKKNGLKDLEKVLHYLEKRIESIHKYRGIIRGARKNDELFLQFCLDNAIPVRERVILDSIMHWKRVDQLISAHHDVQHMIEELKEEGRATSAYVNQDR
jgi:hypothetical protein